MKGRTVALWLGLACATGFTHADTLVIPIGQQQASQAQPLPVRGVSSAAVIQRYGQPTERHAPVGEPPIKRWDYPAFSVYFEQDHVVHSVRHHRSRNPRRP